MCAMYISQQWQVCIQADDEQDMLPAVSNTVWRGQSAANQVTEEGDQASEQIPELWRAPGSAIVRTRATWMWRVGSCWCWLPGSEGCSAARNNAAGWFCCGCGTFSVSVLRNSVICWWWEASSAQDTETWCVLRFISFLLQHLSRHAVKVFLVISLLIQFLNAFVVASVQLATTLSYRSRMSRLIIGRDSTMSLMGSC